jgi:agmatinase
MLKKKEPIMELPIGQGHGVAGNYAGLPKKYTDPKKSAVVILPVPFDMTTTYQYGAHKGPEALIEASRNLELYDIETDSEVYERGIYTAPAIEAQNSEEMRKKTHERVAHYVEQGQFVVTLGGEHSISIAPIKAHLERYPNLSVLQFDAHADLVDAYEGNPWSHASVMQRVKELPGIGPLVAVGIRSMSVEEVKNMDRTHTFFAHDLDAEDTWMEKAVALLTNEVYITFDLDAFDSSIMPSTGTPEPGGLNWRQATKLLQLVAKKKKIVGCDVLELCPNSSNIAPDFLAAKLVYKILSYKFKYGVS